MRRKETGVQRFCVCVCVWEEASSCVHLCVAPCDVCSEAPTRTWDENTLFMCVFVCVYDLTEGLGGGLLYWKVLLSSPVQHAGLAPAVSHGAVPPSPLPICIRRRQAEMWQTNLAHTAPAASLPWTLSRFSPRQGGDTRWSSSKNPPAHTLRHKRPGYWGQHVNKMKGGSRLRPVFLQGIIVIHKERKARALRRWEGLSLLCHLDKTSPESKYPPFWIFLLLQDGNVHLKTSLQYCGYITQLSALLSRRQVPIKPLIYGAWCIPWPWRGGSLAEIWEEIQRTHSKWVSV